MRDESICLFLARWGAWPPYASLLVRTLELNPTIRFLVLGVTGVLVVVAGLAYHRFSKQVETWADGVLAKVFGGFRPKGAEEPPPKVVETAA